MIPKRPLSELVHIDRNAVQPESIADGTRYVGLDCIETGGRILRVDEVSAGELASSKYAFDDRHILFGKLRPNLAKVARPDFSGICSTDILPIRPRSDVDRDYLAHYLVSPEAVAWATSRTSGANLPRLSPTVLGTLPVPLPPLPEQRRIASILDEAQRVLDLCKRSLLAGDMLESALLMQLMAKAEKCERPVRLDSVAETLTGPFGSALHRADYAPGGVPIVNPMHIVAGQIKTSDDFAVGTEKASELTAYRLRVNDVVLGRRGELGRAAAVREEHLPALCGTGSMIVRPRLSNLPAAYLAGVLASPSIKRRLESQAQGATMLNLNQAIVVALPIAVPSDKDLQEFDMRLAVVRKLKDSLLQRLRVQQQLLDTLQARAFRGEL